MRKRENRKYPRLKQKFPVRLYKNGIGLSLEGTSVNISQRGAFIKTKNWQSFEVSDQGVFAFFLPPKFTGQDKAIGLQGVAVVARVDREAGGIGVEFVKNFKQFEPVGA